MDVEKTIQFLIDNAAAHDVRLAKIEKALLRLTENQIVLQEAQKDTRKDLRDLGKKTDERIEKLVKAIVALSRQRSNGSKGGSKK